jgi:hypothetical protein
VKRLSVHREGKVGFEVGGLVLLELEEKEEGRGDGRKDEGRTPIAS